MTENDALTHFETQDSEGAEDYNEVLISEYEQHGLRKACEYLKLHFKKIDIDYQEGLLLSIVIEKQDKKMLEVLFKLGVKAGLQPALEIVAYQGNVEFAGLLIDYGVDPRPLKRTTAYTNFPHMQAFLDQKIAEKYGIHH
jgi:hypothetical protein